MLFNCSMSQKSSFGLYFIVSSLIDLKQVCKYIVPVHQSAVEDHMYFVAENF